MNEWIRFFDAMALQGKNIFSVTELANASGSPLDSQRVALTRLRQAGVLTSPARGFYARPHRVSWEELLPLVDASAYLSCAGALEHHGLITQRLLRVDAFSRRRYTRSPERATELGRVLFHSVNPPVYHHPGGVWATPEQALFDEAWRLRRRGARIQGMYTFGGGAACDPGVLAGIADRYPKTVQNDVQETLDAEAVVRG